jgi:uncharacterized phage protein (TIGR01671 family)
MSREIKFRAWFIADAEWVDFTLERIAKLGNIFINYENWRRFTGLKDKNGVEIYEGDVVEFSDKWEWYRAKYGPTLWFADGERREKILKEYEAEPMERRCIEIPKDYEWLMTSELQSYWEVIGNIYENSELLEKPIDTTNKPE